MTGAAASFPFVLVLGPPPTLRPVLPHTLDHAGTTLDELGLVDSGSDNSILPFDLGARLGSDWSRQLPLQPIGGILSGVAARAVILTATVQPFPAVRLAFAWVQSDRYPLILGQANFFLEFDIAFYRHRGIFTVEPHQP